ncbi:MAG: class I SAM-dependent methyltransferase, partial [Verrucomicrobiota bacterium]|nr:class I SAM-dependent methyltransferase [Verrucomicrobiota bacterium]
QYKYVKQKINQEHLDHLIEVKLMDYRYLTGKFDRVISIEMLEAVGHEYLSTYFNKIYHLLNPGGKCMFQCITIPENRYESYLKNPDFIQTHIFPGGHLPSPTAICKHVANAGETQVLSMHRFGSDYARTLRYWAQSFNREESLVESLGFDASFRRKWKYYLSYCEAGFDAGLIDVQHIEIVKS